MKRVSAINASEVVINFSVEVDADTVKGNVEVKINDEVADIEDVKVDGKKAILLLDNTTFQNGDRYTVQTSNAILTKGGKKLDKFASEEMEFNASKAPTLENIEADLSNNDIILTFDRPVEEEIGMVKVDDVTLVKALSDEIALERVDGPKAGNYDYKLINVDSESMEEALEVGEHNIKVFDVADTAAAYPAKSSVLSGTYTIVDEQVVPAIQGIEAINGNKFFIELNREIEELEKENIKVEKGNHEFETIAVDLTTDITVLDKKDSVYVVQGNHNKKNGLFVVVTDGDKNNENPLYKGNESSADLKVTVENYKADGLIGEKSVQNVTLKKNDSKPAVKSTKVDGEHIEVVFNENLEGDGVNRVDQIVVRDKDNVIITPNSVNTSDATVKIEFSDTLENGPYTVQFKADQFKYAETDNSVVNYLVNTVKNDEITVTAETGDESTFKYHALASENITAGALNNERSNIITVAYGKEMTDSAINPSNYTLDGEALPTGTQVDFINDKKTVQITIPKETIKKNSKYRLSISTDVTTAQGEHIVQSTQTKVTAYNDIELKDNVSPEINKAIYLVANSDDKTTKEILVTFTEAVSNSDKDDFEVIVNGSTQSIYSVTNNHDSKEDQVLITLDKEVNISQVAVITIADEDIETKDGNNNTAKVGSSSQAKTIKLK